MLAWKRGNAVLTAGNVKVTMNPRIRLIPVHELPEVNGASVKSPTGYNLELRDVRVTDAGDYACKLRKKSFFRCSMSTLVPLQVRSEHWSHRKSSTNWKCLYRRKSISYLRAAVGWMLQKARRFDWNVVARAIPRRKSTGRERFVSFFPPLISMSVIKTQKSFSRSQNNLMPNGEANVTGNTFEILHGDRHSAGHYRCSADNRVGAADTREIFVNVLCKEMNHRSLSLYAHLSLCSFA